MEISDTTDPAKNLMASLNRILAACDEVAAQAKAVTLEFRQVKTELPAPFRAELEELLQLIHRHLG